MSEVSGKYWLDHCRKARPRPAGIAWDVFISYRSADRVWALALYDMLQQCGYTIFLDQYVLAAGSGVLTQLSENMRKSASGVIVWSERSLDSDWVEREIGAMVERRDSTKKSPNPFYFVAAKLDSEKLPDLLAGSLYIDFSTYPDGPTGAELVRLTSGLQGAGLDPEAVGRIAEFESEVREEPTVLRALVAAGGFEKIRERALAGTVAYTTSATLPALAAEMLIKGAHYDDALAIIEAARQRFRRSVRLRQMKGLGAPAHGPNSGGRARARNVARRRPQRSGDARHPRGCLDELLANFTEPRRARTSARSLRTCVRANANRHVFRNQRRLQVRHAGRPRRCKAACRARPRPAA